MQTVVYISESGAAIGIEAKLSSPLPTVTNTVEEVYSVKWNIRQAMRTKATGKRHDARKRIIII